MTEPAAELLGLDSFLQASRDTDDPEQWECTWVFLESRIFPDT